MASWEPFMVPLAVGQWDWSQLVSVGGFEWVPGVTPMSNWQIVAGAAAIYLASLVVLKLYMRGKPKQDVNGLLGVHNLVLCLWSLVMFVGIAEGIVSAFLDGRGRDIFCETSLSNLRGRFYYWGYLYYLSKFYELFDTWFMILKHRPLSFLHVFHHATVMAIVWSWFSYGCVLGLGLGALFNTGIHVFMYYYYYLSSRGQTVWYKRYITTMQIVQFVCSFLLSTPFVFFDAAGGNWSQWPLKHNCIGFESFVFTAGCNLAFLALFVNFYLHAYPGKGKGTGEGKTSGKAAEGQSKTNKKET